MILRVSRSTLAIAVATGALALGAACDENDDNTVGAGEVCGGNQPNVAHRKCGVGLRCCGSALAMDGTGTCVDVKTGSCASETPDAGP